MTIDPKDAGTIVSVIVDDVFAPAAQALRQCVVVRVRRQLRRHHHELPPGAKVRPPQVVAFSRTADTGSYAASVAEHVTFAATYQRYDARRISNDLRGRYVKGQPVCVSVVRALMKSTTVLQPVKETVDYEEAY